MAGILDEWVDELGSGEGRVYDLRSGSYYDVAMRITYLAYMLDSRCSVRVVVAGLKNDRSLKPLT